MADKSSKQNDMLESLVSESSESVNMETSKHSTSKSKSKTKSKTKSKNKSKTKSKTKSKGEEDYQQDASEEKHKQMYKMKGMGSLLSMYGGAGEEIENDYNEKRQTFLETKEAYALEIDKKKREELRQMMIKSKESMELAKEKMKILLRGISEASAKAASQLN